MVKKILYGVGLFIVFLMVLGMILNYLLPLVGVNKPLSSLPILIGFWLCVVTCAILYLRKHRITFQFPQIPLSICLLLILPILTVSGTSLVNHSGNNILLMILIPLIVVVTVLCMFTKVIPEKYWAFAIWMMAVSIVLHRALISPYLIGTDNILEFRCFKAIEDNGIWSSINTWYATYNSVASVTVLPTMISKITFIDGMWVFKLIFPILLSLLPVAVYEFVKSQFNSKIAFLSAFLVMSVYAFYTVMIMTDKQLVASFLMAVFLLALFSEVKYKYLILSALGFGIVFSHYSTAVLFCGLLIAVAVYTRKLPYIAIASGLSVILFAWYKLHDSGAVVSNLSYIGSTMVSGDLSTTESNTVSIDSQFIPETETDTSPADLVTRILTQGISYLPAPVLIIYFISQVLITIGFVSILWKWFIRKERTIRVEYLVISFCFITMLALEVFPSFSNFVGLDRIYVYCMMLLAPFMFMALEKITRKYWVIVGVFLVSLFFLWNVGYINQIQGKPLIDSIALNLEKSDESVFTKDELEGAKWVLDNTKGIIYADNYSQYIFYYLDKPLKEIDRVAYNVLRYRLVKNEPRVKNTVPSGSCIYLRKANLVHDGLTMRYYSNNYEYTIGFKLQDLGEFEKVVDTANILYENKDCKIIQTTIGYGVK